MKPKRVVHILCRLNPGGAERMVLDLSKRLPKEQYAVSVIATHGGGLLEQAFQAAGISTYIIGDFSTRSARSKNSIVRALSRTTFAKLFALARLLRQLQPDIVHTHLFAGDTWGRIATVLAFPAVLLRLLGLRITDYGLRVPVVVSTEHNTNVDEGSAKRWIKWALQFVTDRIVAVSDAVRKYSMLVDGIHAEKMAVIRHGVEMLHAEPRRQNDGRVIIGCVARLEQQKGHAVLLDAFRQLDQMLQVRSELWVIGDGSLRSVLEAQVREFGIEKQVKFFGARTDAADLLALMDIVILPSLWEGAGIAALEAAVARKPVIASRVGGLPEYVRAEESGTSGEVSAMLVEPGDAHALATALEQLIADPELRQQMGEAGQRLVAEKFTLERVVGEYTSLYEHQLRVSSFEFRVPRLRDAVVAVTYLCQSRCNMCSIWMNKERPKLMPADMALLPTTLRNINISGGEPFLRADLPELIRAVKARCPKAQLIISSNGFATKRILEHMKKILVIDPGIGVAISLDGVGAMHDAVRGIPGGFRMCVETVRGLQKLGMNNIRIAFTAQAMNITHLPIVDQLAQTLGVQFTMSAVHNSSHYFQKEDNAHDRLETYRQPFATVIDRALVGWSPKRWLRAYYMHALLRFLETGSRMLPSYSGVRSFFLDPNRRVHASVVSASMYGVLPDGIPSTLRASASAITDMIRAHPEKTARSQAEQHWMICTAREAMRVHWARVGWWVLKEKMKLHLTSVPRMMNKELGIMGDRASTVAAADLHS